MQNHKPYSKPQSNIKCTKETMLKTVSGKHCEYINTLLNNKKTWKQIIDQIYLNTNKNI